MLSFLPLPHQAMHPSTIHKFNPGAYIFSESVNFIPTNFTTFLNFFPFHTHIFIVPSYISSPFSLMAKLVPYPKSREFERIYTPDPTTPLLRCPRQYNCIVPRSGVHIHLFDGCIEITLYIFFDYNSQIDCKNQMSHADVIVSRGPNTVKAR